MPALVAEILAFVFRETPTDCDPVPHEEPLTVIEPELVVTLDPSTVMPTVESTPFAAVPVIVTLPAPVAEMVEDKDSIMPQEFDTVLHEVPLTVSEPELVVRVAPDARMP